MTNESEGKIEQKIREGKGLRTIEFMCAIFLGYFFGGVSGIYSFKNLGIEKSIEERIIKALNKSPIRIKYEDINSDGIEYRVLSNKSGLYQEQFGYVNPKTGGTEYLTLEQIRERVKSELEKTMRNYKPQEKVLK